MRAHEPAHDAALNDGPSKHWVSSAGAGGPRHQARSWHPDHRTRSVGSERTCWNRPQARSTSTRTARCCPATCSSRTAGLPAPCRPLRRPLAESAHRLRTGWRSHLAVTTSCVIIPRSQHLSRPAIHPAQRRSSWAQGDRRSRLRSIIRHALLHVGSLDPPIEQLQRGYHYATVLSIADKVVDAVKSGPGERGLRHRWLRRRRARTQLLHRVRALCPQESIIPDAGLWQKYRILGHDYSSVASLPRLLDVGQCN